MNVGNTSTVLSKKLDRISSQQNMQNSITLNNHVSHNLKDNKDTCLINLTNTELPKNVYDFLRLGDNLASPFLVDTRTKDFELLKDIERNIKYINKDEREEIRFLTTMIIKNNSKNRERPTPFDTISKIV